MMVRTPDSAAPSNAARTTRCVLPLGRMLPGSPAIVIAERASATSACACACAIGIVIFSSFMLSLPYAHTLVHLVAVRGEKV